MRGERSAVVALISLRPGSGSIIEQRFGQVLIVTLRRKQFLIGQRRRTQQGETLCCPWRCCVFFLDVVYHPSMAQTSLLGHPNTHAAVAKLQACFSSSGGFLGV